jgi:hypothetical protein
MKSYFNALTDVCFKRAQAYRRFQKGVWTQVGAKASVDWRRGYDWDKDEYPSQVEVWQKLHFFFGGMDAEMAEIQKIIFCSGHLWSNKHLKWGAKASVYESEVYQAFDDGHIPVLVELELDIKLPKGAIIIDHHNDQMWKKPSLIQVLQLLGKEPGKSLLLPNLKGGQQLIADNDIHNIPELMARGYSDTDIAEVREYERKLSGMTLDMEKEAERVITEVNAYEKAKAGELVVVYMSHSKVSTVSERLAPYWKDGWEHLLVFSADGEVNYYGDGSVCEDFKNNFPSFPAPWNPGEKVESWGGKPGFGKKGEHAFCGGYPANHLKVETFIRQRLAEL